MRNTITHVAAAAMVFALVGVSTSQAGLIAYYKLDDSSLPITTATIGPDGAYEEFDVADLQQPPSPGSGSFDSVRFDASNEQRIAINNSLIGGQTALTMSAWVNFDNTDQDNTIASIGQFTGGQPLIFWRDENDGAVNNTLAVLIGPNRTKGVSDILNDTGVWRHVAFTYEANTANGLNLYLDGVLIGTTNADTASFPASSDILTFGNSSVGPAASKQFGGFMDEIAIYDHALTPAEIQALANGALVIPVPEPSTLALLGFSLLGLVAIRKRRVA